MPKFVFAYHGQPKIDSPEAGQAHMKAWRAWMAGMGEAVIDPGLPLKQSSTVHADGSVTDDGGPNPLAGITVIEVADLESALAHAKACPHVTGGGSIEVAEALDMEM